ncbi:ABC transporter ATP-binding protein [Fulvivirgaceae bacterium BMA12]|uniref:ABC transporter ATP-binding protein n=1 Tax=Agaribacillus aureus TaxID=3051825 RepID=A0ABT8L4K5_9BACT|nr:ABC transporter ATP-binding protein [Fulvivirgaceae bacterium BMA12]
MLENIVKVENLYHKYGKDWAVKDVSFEIKSRGILGLLGSNGAGKSTTMNILCGVLNQTEGQVWINDINVRQKPIEARRYIGFLPQKAPLHLDLTVDEYLFHCAHLRLMQPKEIKSAVERVKDYCDIGHHSQRLLRNLSGGYQQRVGIAQAIIHNPTLVVLDEPTNGLDPVQIAEVRKLIKEIGKDRAVILSTHILSEVQAICDEIKMMECGRLVFSGSLREFNDYQKPDTLLMTFETCPSLGELNAIPGVTKVSPVDERTIRLQYNKAISEILVKKSVEKGWRLKEIYIEKNSLDDIFAKLSQENLQTNPV